MKTGVMIVGARGATAHTTMATAQMCGPEQLAPFLISADFEDLDLADVADIAFGGWDVIDESWEETVRRHYGRDSGEEAAKSVRAALLSRHPALFKSMKRKLK